MLISKLAGQNTTSRILWQAPIAAIAMFLIGCDNKPINESDLETHDHHHAATDHAHDHHAQEHSHNHHTTTPRYNSKYKLADVNRTIDAIREDLFRGHLLETVDRLDRVYFQGGFHHGRGQVIETLASERLSPEVFTLAWENLFLEKPDQVIVGEYTDINDFELSDDQGRGLRLILRKQVGWFNISAIIFLDYNEETKKLEFPESHRYQLNPDTIPDAMRVLIDVYEDIPETRFKTFEETTFIEFQEAGIVGASIDATITSHGTRVSYLDVRPHNDPFFDFLSDTNGNHIHGLIETFSCSSCHGQGSGFIDSTGSSGFADKQSTIHLHQDEAIDDFLATVARTKSFASESEKTKVLARLRTQLENPEAHLSDLLPTGLTAALEAKHKELRRSSTLYREYQLERQKARDAKHFDLALTLISERLTLLDTSNVEMVLEYARLKASIETQITPLKEDSRLDEAQTWLGTASKKLERMDQRLSDIKGMARIKGSHSLVKDLDETQGNLTAEEVKLRLAKLVLDKASRVNSKVWEWKRNPPSNDDIRDAVSSLARYETILLQLMVQFPRNERFRRNRYVLSHFTEDAIEYAKERGIDWRSVYEESSKAVLQL